MKKIKVLSVNEMREIQGGDWIKDLGRGTHKAWCSFVSGVSRGFSNMMSYSDTNNVG